MILIAMCLCILCFLVIWWISIKFGGFIGNLLNDEKGRKIGKAIPFWLGFAFIIYMIGTPILSYRYFSYLCHKNAGQKVYKTVEQWKEENPNVFETLKQIHSLNEYDKNFIENHKEIKIDNKKYTLSTGGNNMVLQYFHRDEFNLGTINYYSYIIFDSITNSVIAQDDSYVYSILPFTHKVCEKQRKVSIDDFSNPKLNELE